LLLFLINKLTNEQRIQEEDEKHETAAPATPAPTPASSGESQAVVNYTEAIKFGLNAVNASSVPLDDDASADASQAPPQVPKTVRNVKIAVCSFYVNYNF